MLIYFWERERAQAGDGWRDWERIWGDSMLARKNLMQVLNSWTARSWLELKSNAQCLLCRHSINIYSVQEQGVRIGRKISKKFFPIQRLRSNKHNSLNFSSRLKSYWIGSVVSKTNSSKILEILQKFFKYFKN